MICLMVFSLPYSGSLRYFAVSVRVVAANAKSGLDHLPDRVSREWWSHFLNYLRACYPWPPLSSFFASMSLVGGTDMNDDSKQSHFGRIKQCSCKLNRHEFEMIGTAS